MELNIRDWMVVIVVLLLLAVALDGYRRAQKERRNQVRLSRNARKADLFKEPDEGFTSELPNGGARVVGVYGESTQTKDTVSATPASPDASSFSALDDDNEDIPGDEIDPLFDDPIKRSQKISTPKVSNPNISEPRQSEEPLISRPESSVKESSVNKSAVENKIPEEVTGIDDSPASKQKPAVHQPSLFDQDARNLKDPEEIIVMSVIASQPDGFAGEDLLHILLACDCRFGEMNIFHRYEKENAAGEIQFSVINVVEPGVFKLDNIKEFSTPGVSFFVRLPGPEDPMMAFNCMVETAQCLAKNLDGVVKDEQRSTVTEQTIEHTRQRIRDYLHRQLTNA